MTDSSKYGLQVVREKRGSRAESLAIPSTGRIPQWNYRRRVNASSWKSTLKRNAPDRSEPISKATLETWHLEKILFRLANYELTSIALKQGLVVEIVGDYEDPHIRLVYSATTPRKLSEIHFSSTPSVTGMIVRRPDELVRVSSQLITMVLKNAEMLADAMQMVSQRD